MATLIALAGLPGVGKSSLARALAARQPAVLLRIDTIEQVLRRSGQTVGAAGYGIAQAIARDNLRLGSDVIADMVNPVAASRQGWRDIAADASARLVEIELVCSDLAEHRRRVEGRISDIPGLCLPDWAAVERLVYEPWDRPAIVIDTAGLAPGELLASLWDRLDRR